MKRSTNRILTTHPGSIARPLDLIEGLLARDTGKPHDKAALDARIKRAVTEVVRKQVECGVDIPNDGEQSKLSFVGYANDRITGFEARPGQGAPGGGLLGRERKSFPEFYDWQARTQSAGVGGGGGFAQQVCVGPITYKGQAAVKMDIDNLKASLQGLKHEEAFLPAASPTQLEGNRKNEYYKTEDEFLTAIANAMNVEFKAIVDAGMLVQTDDPRLVTFYQSNPDMTVDQVRKWAERRVEVINQSLKGIPTDKVRFHTCYSIDIGPRVYDMELKDIVDIMLKINGQAYSFEAANPRHDHEYHVWEKVKLPQGKILIPGVISHTTNLVEHPELVSERLVRYAKIVGRENVIAGADCGFAQGAFTRRVHPTIMWAKLKALSQGAKVASKQLWRR